MEEAAHEGAGGDDYGAGVVTDGEVGLDAAGAAIRRKDADSVALLEIDEGGAFESGFGAKLVSLFVALGARGSDTRPLGGVKHAALDGSGVRVECHEAAEGVNLADYVALGQAADRWVAGHLAHGVGILREEEGLATKARRGQRGLDPGMAGAEDDDVVRFWVREHWVLTYLTHEVDCLAQAVAS